MDEEVLEPELQIVDAHHHLWGARPQLTLASGKQSLRPTKYLFDELLADVNSGHNIRATVYIDAQSMYRADGPEEFRSVGETEFVNGVAAMSASGQYGESRLCAGIIGRIDFRMGDVAAEVLDAHIAASGRFRGIRQGSSYDPDPAVLGNLAPAPEGLLRSDEFRSGFTHLADRDLVFDAFMLSPQLSDATSLAAAFPGTTIVLNHVGTPLGLGSYDRVANFDSWRADLGRFAEASPNTQVKLGGLGMAFNAFPSFRQEPPAGSEQLADEWTPYVDAAIELFGVDRCMFESNFPVEIDTASYRTLWNAFKRIAGRYTAEEKAALFSGTATRVYSLEY